MSLVCYNFISYTCHVLYSSEKVRSKLHFNSSSNNGDENPFVQSDDNKGDENPFVQSDDLALEHDAIVMETKMKY